MSHRNLSSEQFHQMSFGEHAGNMSKAHRLEALIEAGKGRAQCDEGEYYGQHDKADEYQEVAKTWPK